MVTTTTERFEAAQRALGADALKSL
jgi:hypothetical protein